MTLNIWNLSPPWRSRREEIVAWLELVGPDVLCLQEVVESPGARNQARWLAEHCAADYHVAYGAGAMVGEHAVGNAVVSRWPIDSQAVAPLPRSRKEDDLDRIVVHARTNGLDVFCTHLAWRLDDAAVRERQVRALVDWIRTRAAPDAQIPPIVAGDMNAEPASNEIRYLTGLASLDGDDTCFQDAWALAGGGGAGFTWDNRNPFAATVREPDRRIDYVLVGWRPLCSVWVRDARLVCDRALTSTFATDHFGVVADLVTGS